jgi:hypothetical protein
MGFICELNRFELCECCWLTVVGYVKMVLCIMGHIDSNKFIKNDINVSQINSMYYSTKDRFIIVYLSSIDNNYNLYMTSTLP